MLLAVHRLSIMSIASSMSSVQHLRELISERLTAAAEEIFSVVQRTIVQYEEEMDRQRRLLDVTWRADSGFQRADFPRCSLRKEAFPSERQLGAAIKEEREEKLWSSQQDELLVLKQEAEEGDQREPESNRDGFHHQRPDQEGDMELKDGGNRKLDCCPELEDKTDGGDASPQRDAGGKDSNKNSGETSFYRIHRDFPKHFLWKEADQAEPEPTEIKEEQQEEDLCFVHHVDQPLVKQEIDSFLVTSDYEETDPSESDQNRIRTLFNLPPAAGGQLQDQEGIWDEDSGSSRKQNLCSSAESGKKSLKCAVCSKTFSSNFKMRKHHRIHTGEKPYSCKICRKAFRESKYLSVHMRTHTGEKPYSCETCGKSFSQNSHLSSHRRTHTGEKPHPCGTCGRRFAEASALRNHMLTHTGEKPFSCHICGKILRYSSSLSAHMKIHTGEKPFVCKTCGKCFSHNSSLISHMRIHTGEKSYQCTTCGRCFSHSTTLLRHTRSHTGERPYSCATCGKCFNSSSHLTVHMTTHSREKLYSCGVCGKRFSHGSNLVRHTRTHTGERPYSCQTCAKRFKSSTHLSRHMKTHRKGRSAEVEIVLEDGGGGVPTGQD